MRSAGIYLFDAMGVYVHLANCVGFYHANVRENLYVPQERLDSQKNLDRYAVSSVDARIVADSCRRKIASHVLKMPALLRMCCK